MSRGATAVAAAIASVARGSSYPWQVSSGGGAAWNMPDSPGDEDLIALVDQTIRQTLAISGRHDEDDGEERSVRPAEVLFMRSYPPVAVDMLLFRPNAPAERASVSPHVRTLLEAALDWAQVTDVRQRDVEDDTTELEVDFSPKSGLVRRQLTATSRVRRS